MRNFNDIKNLLDIQNTNITFPTNSVEVKSFKGRLFIPITTEELKESIIKSKF